MWQDLLSKMQAGDFKTLARCISLVENEVEGFEDFMQSLPANQSTNIIGITGPPGAGKSTLTDALISSIVNDGKSVAVLCIDPSSPFHFGAVLGDRIRMSEWYNNPKVYIRSLASRGSMGGLHPKIIEICELVKTAQFDYIIIETVGVGQSEIEIAGLADITLVVLVPESGDEIQTMKAGLMEIADIFVVNKSDRPGADAFVRNLRQMLAPAFQQEKEIPIVQTVAADKLGVDVLYQAILSIEKKSDNSRKYWLLAQRAYHLIQQKRMKDVDIEQIKSTIKNAEGKINLYQLVKPF